MKVRLRESSSADGLSNGKDYEVLLFKNSWYKIKNDENIETMFMSAAFDVISEDSIEEIRTWFDFRGAIEYCKNKNISTEQMTAEEVAMFEHKLCDKDGGFTNENKK